MRARLRMTPGAAVLSGFVLAGTAHAQPLREIPETRVEGSLSGDSAMDTFPRQPLSPNVVTSATRMETSRNRVGSSVSVVDGEQIRSSGQTSLHEVLRNVPGLDVVETGGPGRQTSVFLRGTNSNQTKVLIDGIPVNDPGGPNHAFDFSTLSVDNIERVEWLLGPQGTHYGSAGVGGLSR